MYERAKEVKLAFLDNLGAFLRGILPRLPKPQQNRKSPKPQISKYSTYSTIIFQSKLELNKNGGAHEHPLPGADRRQVFPKQLMHASQMATALLGSLGSLQGQSYFYSYFTPQSVTV